MTWFLIHSSCPHNGSQQYSILCRHTNDPLSDASPFFFFFKEWTGDWSDKSSLWTDELKQEFGWADSDDGSFWIHVDDVIR
jgi:hypothetical protein